LVAAVALSIIEVVARGARPNDAVLGFVPRLDRYGDVRFHRSAQVDAGVVVYRLDDRLFFANAEYVVGRINEAIAGAATDTRYLVFDAERVPGIDVTAIEMLDRLIRDLRARGIDFIVARASRDVVAALERSAVLDAGDEGRVFPTVHAAVASCRDRATSPESGDDPVGA
ncbi:MAG: STAS domain-containing protein, partial [Acidimicrobiales bacterium]